MYFRSHDGQVVPVDLLKEGFRITYIKETQEIIISTKGPDGQLYSWNKMGKYKRIVDFLKTEEDFCEFVMVIAEMFNLHGHLSNKLFEVIFELYPIK